MIPAAFIGYRFNVQGYMQMQGSEETVQWQRSVQCSVQCSGDDDLRATSSVHVQRAGAPGTAAGPVLRFHGPVAK
jgi:hypothetical protein